jgi:hypothetical protein
MSTLGLFLEKLSCTEFQQFLFIKHSKNCLDTLDICTQIINLQLDLFSLPLVTALANLQIKIALT